MKEGKEPFSSLRRTAGEVKRYRTYRRVIPVAIGAIVAFLSIAYVVSLLFNKYGSFTVSVVGRDDRKYSLALSESPSFSQPTSRLNCTAAKDVTNIDGNTLPDNLNDVNGEHNGENYVAYTFYLKNTGEESCSYRYSIVISKMTAGIDAAVRVRVYYTPFYYDSETGKTDYGGAYVDYAKPKTGGNGAPEIDPDGRVMTNFYSGNTVLSDQTDGFKAGDISKITVAIWIEGNDPECTDDCLGGEFKVDMLFEIAGTGEEKSRSAGA